MTYIIKTSVFLDFTAFAEYLNYSGIEYQPVNENMEPVNFETGYYELNNMNFNLLQLTLPDDFDLIQLKLPEEQQKRKSGYSFCYLAQKNN